VENTPNGKQKQSTYKADLPPTNLEYMVGKWHNFHNGKEYIALMLRVGVDIYIYYTIRTETTHFVIFSRIFPGILSDVYFDILAGNHLAFERTYILKFHLAFYLTCYISGFLSGILSQTLPEIHFDILPSPDILSDILPPIGFDFGELARVWAQRGKERLRTLASSR